MALEAEPSFDILNISFGVISSFDNPQVIFDEEGCSLPWISNHFSFLQTRITLNFSHVDLLLLVMPSSVAEYFRLLDFTSLNI